MIVTQPSTANSGHHPIDGFLDAFADRCEEFKQVCADYLQGKVELDQITRAMSEATADAELKFSEFSFQMSMEQLQRFGMLQKILDSMMVEIFEADIINNRQTCARAIENGEYFLVGLTFRSIESAIYMRHSKDRIKLDQERRLSSLQQEQQSTEAMLKVIKALQQALEGSLDATALGRIEKAVGLYVSYFQPLERSELLSACDRRVLSLIKQHFESLRALPGDHRPHLNACCQPLRSLPQPDALEPLLSECRTLAASSS
ncbi:MAG: hypothetical protein CVV27_02465 [Candidatus Melainabacteria bacterium HGW-Melainabacteria-1]|nr:MAG: hypothetical protein CVV27_02465 [Candidatus Melainabacteria bacterium HGW-Melainabacteria-1]